MADAISIKKLFKTFSSIKEHSILERYKLFGLSLCDYLTLVIIMILTILFSSHYSLSIVMSGSMLPKMQIGAICIMEDTTFDELSVGDVAVYNG